MPKGGSGSVKYFTGIPIPSSLGLTAFMASCVRMGKYVGAKGWVTSVASAGKAVLHGTHADWAALRRQGDLPGGTVLLFGELGGFGEVHLLSLVFVAWGAAMVSKTLRVSSELQSCVALLMPVIITGPQAVKNEDDYTHSV